MAGSVLRSNAREALVPTRGMVLGQFFELTCHPCFQENMLVGRGGLEPPTSRLSGVRSNHLSYRPIQVGDLRNYCSEEI
jgi:hypothetical protein